MQAVEAAVSLGLFGMIIGIYTYVHACANDNHREIREHKEKVDGEMKAQRDRLDTAVTDIKDSLAEFRVDVASRLTRIETKVGSAKDAVQ